MGKIVIMVLLIALISMSGIAGAAKVTVKPSFSYGGQGADGHTVVMWNYNNAKNPSYSTLVAAVRADQTDAHIYGIKTYKCTDYAEELHNNLEKQGIKCGIASVKFTAGNGHAVVVVKTTNKGTMFVDCCGTGEGKKGQDAFAKIGLRQKYTLNLFTGETFQSNKIVKNVYQYW